MALYDDILRESMMAGRAATQMGPESGINMGASVVPPLYSQYNPAGAYAEAGRTVPNRVSEQAMAMNQLTQPQGGVPSDLHNWNDPYGRPDDTPFYEQRMPYFGDASVVAPPRMPTANETVRGVMGPANERDSAFSRIHDA